MNGDLDKQDNLLDTTDCLEAVSVFRGWKNFLFVIAFCCLLVLQAAFLIAVVKTKAHGKPVEDAKSSPAAQLDIKIPSLANLPNDVNISTAVQKVTADANAQPEEASKGLLRFVKLAHIQWAVRFVNFILVLVATLYCLTMLFSLKVSLLGRLGGINHICRAFFISLLFLVILLPWQIPFGPVVKGAMFTADELVTRCQADRSGIFTAILFYLRFIGYWIVVVAALFFAQLRSGRWTRATLRRLEII
jgi:hypothetical protein